MSALHVGTCGWSYAAWKHLFYGGAPQREWLERYAEHFDTVEVDGTFYRVPPRAIFEGWRDRTPAGFLFAMKGSRFVTHTARIYDPGALVERARDRAAGLGDKLAAVVWQLPTRTERDDQALDALLEALAGWRGPHQVIELRHRSWFTPDVAARLARAGVTNCISDAADWPRWDHVEGPVVYVRLHGRPVTYGSAYGARGVATWARRAERWLGEGREVFVYFDNDAAARAPQDARALRERVAVGGGVPAK